MTKDDVVYLVKGDHTDVPFKVIEHCISFDDEKKELGLYIIIEPLDPAAFISRFDCLDIKDVELNDIQLVVKQNEIKVMVDDSALLLC